MGLQRSRKTDTQQSASARRPRPAGSGQHSGYGVSIGGAAAVRDASAGVSWAPSAADLRTLQRRAGNQAVIQLLRTRSLIAQRSAPNGGLPPGSAPAVVQRTSEEAHGVIQRFAAYYAWGGANETPHVHVYDDGMHLKSAGGHRYNIIKANARHSQADDALLNVQGKGNKKLRQTIKRTARKHWGIEL